METSAREDKQTALSLVCVSRTVRQWITPLIYHTVVLEYFSRISSLINILEIPRDSGAKSYIGVSIRRLFIRIAESSSQRVAKVIRACPNLDCLITDCVLSHPGFDQGDRSSWPAPWHVLLVLTVVPQLPAMGHLLLRNTTHLCVDYVNSEVINVLKTLPRLTHLGWISWGDDGVEEFLPLILLILHSLKHLHCLVVVAYSQELPEGSISGDVWVDIAQVEDRRVFVRPRMTAVDYRTIVEEGGTIWDNANQKYKEWRKLCTSGPA